MQFFLKDRIGVYILSNLIQFFCSNFESKKLLIIYFLRAREILAGCRGGSVGAYSDSPGIEIIR